MNEKSSNQNRLLALDTIRGIAAIGVAIFHYLGHFGAAPFRDLLYPFYKNGYLLVDFFFVLSGFILMHRYGNSLENGRIGFQDFAARRLARLYPLHLATCLIVFGGQLALYHFFNGSNYIYQADNLYLLVLNLGLLNNVGLSLGPSFNGPSWSISCEIVINLVFALLLFRKRKLLSFSVLVLGSWIIIYSITRNLYEFNKNYFVILNSGLLRCAFGFFTGALAYLLFVKVRSKLKTWHWDLLGLAALSLTAVLLNSFQKYNFLHQADFVLVTVLFPASIICLAQGNHLSRLFSFAPLAFLGTISYSVYLIHFPVQLGIFIYAQRGVQMDFASPSMFFTYLGCVIAASTIAYYLVERPGARLMKRWLCASSKT